MAPRAACRPGGRRSQPSPAFSCPAAGAAARAWALLPMGAFRPAPSVGGGRNATVHQHGGGHPTVHGPLDRGAGLKTGAPSRQRRTRGIIWRVTLRGPASATLPLTFVRSWRCSRNLELNEQVVSCSVKIRGPEKDVWWKDMSLEQTGGGFILGQSQISFWPHARTCHANCQDQATLDTGWEQARDPSGRNPIRESDDAD